MQMKLTIAFLAVGVFSAGAVGLVTNWTLMHDFRQEIRDRAFERFSQDFVEYIRAHPGWEDGIDNGDFDAFVIDRQKGLARPPKRDGHAGPLTDRHLRPPFHFLALNVDGTVLKGAGEYVNGQPAPEHVTLNARPVELDGEIVASVSPVGEIALTPGDQRYMDATHRALVMGLGAAAAVALLFGLAFGRGMSRSLADLISAMRPMHSNVGERQEAPVRGNDELAELSRAFNKISKDLTAAHAELRELGIRDGLTGLYNRRYFDEQAAQAFEQAERYAQPLSVMIGDLDHFKRINDDFSHEAGDHVLERVAQIIEACTRKSDVVARYGGEEFVILFPHTRGDQAVVCCEKIRHEVEAHPWDAMQPGLTVTMSMGVCDDVGLGKAETMVSCADKNLYEAKSSGRNRIVYVTPEDALGE